MKKLLLPLLFISSVVFSQSTSQKYWRNLEESNITLKGERRIIPNKYETVQINTNRLQNLLTNIENTSNGVVLNIPYPGGKVAQFLVTKNDLMHPELQAKFEQIKTYNGKGVTDPTAILKMDITPKGFHALVLSSNHSPLFIDPYASEDSDNHIIYFKKDFSTSKFMDCQVADRITNEPLMAAPGGDCRLRTYRLAISATGEYTAFHGGAQADALAAQVTTMNRVNGVLERDLAITMQIIANNNLIIYTNSATDPFSNGNTGAMINENQSNTDAVIGSANYDLGHIFGTNSGGLAGLGVLCSNGSKARGVTGSAAPIGDPFDIDYVAHEMGHQLGANHTQNNSCNRNNSTAMEPGSASTIMGYAGICNPNVQSNSDDYFHAVSIREMQSVIQGSSCGTITDDGNNNPTVNAGLDYTIPSSTFFELEATGSDPDGGSLTYCWEQMDNTTASMPPASNSTGGPAFRSLNPDASNIRVFPNISDIVSNTTPTWEVVSSSSRTYNFTVTLRDNNGGQGCTYDDDMVVTASNTGSAFTVTAPNTAVSWEALTTQTVTWNVANTTNAPISTANVDIYLSIDGGFTYPIVVATGVPNTGSANVTVPNNPTTTARMKVKGAGNIFFDISNTNFTITAPTVPDYTLAASPAANTVCAPSNAVYTVTIGSSLGYTDPVTLSASGNPAGTSVSFSPNPVVPGNTSTMTVSGTGSAALGTSTITVSGNSTTGTKTDDVDLTINDVPSVPSLTSPADLATGVSLNPSYSWNSIAEATGYDIDIATDAGFTNIVDNATVATNSYTSGITLTASSQYYWRVRASNSCGNSAYATTFSFTTGAVSYCIPTYTNGTNDGDFIDGVVLGTINNTGTGAIGGPDYNDYTGMSTNLIQSTAYSIDIISGDYAPDNYAVMIDYNQDGDFADANEYLGLVASSASYQTNTINFTVPAGATIGATRMRVRCVWNVDPIDPCSSESWGETEDYTVNIQSSCSPPATPTITASGTTSFCAGGSVTLTSSSSTNNEWFEGGVSLGVTTQSLNVTSSGNYTVEVSNGCGTTSSATTTVTVNTLPTVSFSGLGASYCASSSAVTLTGSPVGGSFSGTGITGNTFDPVAAGAGNYNISYSYTDGNGCSNSDVQSTTVNALPTVNFSGLGATYCDTDGAVSLTGSPLGGTFSGTGVSGSSFDPGLAGVGTHNITYSYTDGNGCSNSDVQSATVNSCTVSSNDDCSGAITISCGAVVSDSTTNATVDSLSVPSGCGSGGPTAPGVWYHFVGTGDAVNVSTCDNANYDTRISVYSGSCGALICEAGNDDGTGCTGFTSELNFNSVNGTDYYILIHGYGTASGNFTLSLNCTPPCTPIPSNDECANAQTLSVFGTGACTPVTGTNECASAAIANPSCDPFGVIQDVWYVFNSGSNASIDLSVVKGTATDIEVAVYDGCGGSQIFCGNGSSTTDVATTLNTLTANTDYYIQVWNGGGIEEGTFDICLEGNCPTPTTPTITVNGSDTICSGNSVVLTSSSTVNNQWYLDGNPIPGPAGLATNYVASVAGVYTVEVTNLCGSTMSNPTTITVISTPSTPSITAGGATTFCSGGSVTLTSSSNSANQWYLDGALIGGATNQSYTATTSGNYTVEVSNSCGSTSSAATTVSVLTAPVTPTITAGGSTTFCTGGSVLLTSSASTGNQWYLDGVLIGGATNQSYTATSAGNYTVQVTNACGTATSANTSVTITTTPVTPTISASGSTTICTGNSVTLTSSSSTGNQWYLDGVLIGGATNQTYNATTAGSYTVEVTNSCGVATSGGITITVNTAPATPTVSASGSTTFCAGGSVTLTSSSATANQWYESGVAIAGETNQTLVVSTSGNYTVEVTNSCGATSSATTSVTVNPLPTVTFTGLNANYCADDLTSTLIGNPTGGSFIGNGITGNIFDPSMASGSETITYTYTDGNGCTNSDAQITTVDTVPVVSISGLNASYCDNQSTATIVGTPSGGTFAGQGVSGNIFDPSSAGIGTHTITYSYSDGNGCVGADSISVTVTSSSAPVSGFSQNVTSLSVNFSNTSTGGSLWSWDLGDGNTSNDENPVHTYSTAGTYAVCLITTNGCGVSDTACVNVTVTSNTGPGPDAINLGQSNVWSIYPNPANDVINVELITFDQNASYILIDVLGRNTGVSGSINGDQLTTIDVRDIDAGIYFLDLRVGDQRIIEKVVIEK